MKHVAASLAALALLPAQALNVRAPTPLHARAEPAAEVTARVTPPMALQPLRRVGFWVEVQAPAGRGWLKASALDFGGAGAGPVALDTGRLAGGAIVASSAARGLSPTELLLARPDTTALQALERWTADAATVRQFQTDGGLQPGPAARWRTLPPDTTPAARPRAPEAGW